MRRKNELVRPVLTPAEMAEADRAAIAAGTPESVLVERAGRAVVRHAVRMLGGTYGRRVVVVCGKGNNGADGLVAARVLRGHGIGVDVFELASGFDHAALRRALARADLAIDAMYGTGFRGSLTGDARAVAEMFGGSGVRTLAVDIPSGVDGATGAVADIAVHATETVCLQALKPGLLFEPGRSWAGAVAVADIGIDVGLAASWVAQVQDLRLPERSGAVHKWSSALMVVGGSSGMIGAPMMAALAAARCGAGMVVAGVPADAVGALTTAVEIVRRALPATPDGALAEDAARVVLKEIDRYHALAIGPGLGREMPTQAAVRRLVAEASVPIVVDADALNALATDTAPLRVRHAANFPRAVLTPHEGEYERLAGRPVGADRIEAARALARATESVVLLKGPGTVVAAPSGLTAVNPTDSAALASAGTGDVLTGIIGGLLAAGVQPFEAACTGAYVHGRAASAAGTGPGLVASDLITALPPTLGALRSGTDPWED